MSLQVKYLKIGEILLNLRYFVIPDGDFNGLFPWVTLSGIPENLQYACNIREISIQFEFPPFIHLDVSGIKCSSHINSA